MNERICGSCTDFADKNEALPVCLVKQRTEALVDTIYDGSFFQEPRCLSPKEEFSKLKQRARQKDCPQLSRIIGEFNSKIDPSGVNHHQIRIAPTNTHERAMKDYIGSKMKRSRNRI